MQVHRTHSSSENSWQIIKLDADDFDAISDLHKEDGKLQHLCGYGDGDIMAKGSILGWSLKDMGWEKMD